MSEINHALPLPLRSIWPEGLTALEITVVFPLTSLSVSDVVTYLAEHGLTHKVRGDEVLFPLLGTGDFVGFWGRVNVEPARGELQSIAGLILVLSVWPLDDSDRVVPDESALLADFPSLLDRMGHPSLAASPAMVTSRLVLPTLHWKPAITLPVQLPGILDHASGAPEITGLEVTFGDVNSELRRAEISTLPGTDRFFVNLVTSVSLMPTHEYLHRACESASKHLGLLALRRARAEALAHG